MRTAGQIDRTHGHDADQSHAHSQPWRRRRGQQEVLYKRSSSRYSIQFKFEFKITEQVSDELSEENFMSKIPSLRGEHTGKPYHNVLCLCQGISCSLLHLSDA